MAQFPAATAVPAPAVVAVTSPAATSVLLTVGLVEQTVPLTSPLTMYVTALASIAAPFAPAGASSPGAAYDTGTIHHPSAVPAAVPGLGTENTSSYLVLFFHDPVRSAQLPLGRLSCSSCFKSTARAVSVSASANCATTASDAAVRAAASTDQTGSWNNPSKTFPAMSVTKSSYRDRA